MNRTPRISQSEWDVMNVLWSAGPLTATQVFERLGEKDWKLNTVRTFLTRLEKKKAVKSKNLPEAKTFAAAVSREICIQGEADSFLNRFFGGATGALIAHFAEGGHMTGQEFSELEAILEQKKKETNHGKRKNS